MALYDYVLFCESLFAKLLNGVFVLSVVPGF